MDGGQGPGGATAGTALGRQPEEKEKCPRASTLPQNGGGWGIIMTMRRYERWSDWLVGLSLGGEGERIMLQELPLSSC